MDEKTLQALVDLADRLGATSQYLFEVLVRQALIDGAINTAISVAWLAGLYIIGLFIKSKTKKKGEDGESDWGVGYCELAWAAYSVLVMLVLLVVSCSIPGIVAALANPEYWALNKLLH